MDREERLQKVIMKYREELQKKIKYHLLEHNITLKDYVTGLIKDNLEKNMEQNKK